MSLSIDRHRPLAHLNTCAYRTFNKKSSCERVWQTIKMVKDKNGYVAASATTSGLVLGSIYTFTFSYFCMEGTILSFIEAHETYKKEKHLSQSIGDAGGWLSLPVFSMFAFSTALHQFAREGEFSQVKAFCQDWYKTVTADSIPLENRIHIPIDEFYCSVNNILNDIAVQCIFYKSLTNRILMTLDIVSHIEADIERPHGPVSQLSLDLKLKPIYDAIEKERAVKLSGRNYFQRVRSGITMTEKLHGTRSRTMSIITGIACPLILTFGAVCSAIGEPILGEKIFIRKEDVVEVGHFGEWPDNLMGALTVSYALNRDLVRKGDVFLLYGIYQRHLDTLDPTKTPSGNRDLHNRLCTVGNEEIQQMMSSCFFSTSLNLNLFHPV